MVNLCLGGGGRCPRVLAEFIASAPLTPLLKPDNGIRPIAVGAIWRRLISKVAMRGVGKDITKYLCDFQFGVGVPSGAEAVLHSANRFLSKFHSDGSLAMLTIDFCNAFNLVDRTALLNEVRVRCQSIFFMGELFIWTTGHAICGGWPQLVHHWGSAGGPVGTSSFCLSSAPTYSSSPEFM